MPSELYGPAGLLVGLALAVGALWKAHLDADARDRKQRDEAVAGWREAQEIARRAQRRVKRPQDDS